MKGKKTSFLLKQWINGEMNDLVDLDFYKAFDKVLPKRRLEKLSSHEVKGKIVMDQKLVKRGKTKRRDKWSIFIIVTGIPGSPSFV